MVAKLYTNPISPNCRRVMVAAHELGIPLEIQMIDPSKGDNRTPEYLALNPMGKIPTVVTDDGPLWESSAILAYWAEKFPDKGLLPGNLKDRYDCSRWMFWNACHYEPAAFIGFGEKVLKPMMGRKTDETRYQQGAKDHDRYAPVLNARLQNRTWIMGNDFTIADICLVTSVDCALKGGYDFSKLPNIKSWFDRVTARESWRKASR
jgi:glutathione S-transferase